jgi:hypothetical protein
MVKLTADDKLCYAGLSRTRWTLLALGLLMCPALGCSRTPNAAEIEQITALGGRVATDPFDKSVVKVWLSGTDADDEDMEVVTRLTKLRELHIGGTQVTNEGIKQLTALSKLQTLDVADTSIDDAGIANLQNLTALIRLGIGKTKITDAALNSLTSLPHLRELGVEGTAITDAGMPTLTKITRLRALNLDETNVTIVGVEKLRGLTALQELHLAGTAVDDRAVKTLSGMTSLKTLVMLRTGLSRVGGAAIRKALPKLSMNWPPPPAPKPVAVNGVIRIKAGSATPFKDSSGNMWQAELGFVGGNVARCDPNKTIANTKDPGLYRLGHFGMSSFNCDVPNGMYLAKLHFAETSYPGIRDAGQRVFSLNVQGHEFKDFDVWKKAGGPHRAYVETVLVEVTDRDFKITFTKKTDSPLISAIELVPQTDN